MRDPYEVLGVPRTAKSDDIKKSFRRLAKKLHPDANKNDVSAAGKFAEMNAAYEILGDDEKRKAFDNGEIDAEGKPRFRGFEGFGAHPGGSPGDGTFETFTFGSEGLRRSAGRAGRFGSIDEILKDMFGDQGTPGQRSRFGGGFEPEDFVTRGRGHDATAQITISFAEAATGGSRRVRLPTGKDVEVKIPAGLADGQQIRLKGQGYGSPSGGSSGDALITVSVASHPYLKTEGTNLRVEVPITLYEAVLGAKVRVPTLEGQVDLVIPPGTNAGRTFRLKGKGLPAKGAPGDLYATVRIVLPNGQDPELEELMRKWRDNKPYDPRKEMG